VKGLSSIKTLLSLISLAAVLTLSGCGPSSENVSPGQSTTTAAPAGTTTQAPASSTTTPPPSTTAAAAQTRVVLAEMFTGDW